MLQARCNPRGKHASKDLFDTREQDQRQGAASLGLPASGSRSRPFSSLYTSSLISECSKRASVFSDPASERLQRPRSAVPRSSTTPFVTRTSKTVTLTTMMRARLRLMLALTVPKLALVPAADAHAYYTRRITRGPRRADWHGAQFVLSLDAQQVTLQTSCLHTRNRKRSRNQLTRCTHATTPRPRAGSSA